MGCFSRFLRETKARSGRFIFDRAFWAWRHLACRLFRLGTLEFEYRAAGADEPLPSGIGPGTLCCRCISPLTPGFQTTRCPARTDRPMNFLLCTARHCVKAACPALCCAAPGCSRPRCVRCCPRTPAFPVLADYNIYAAYTDSESFYLWLFGGKKPLALLPRQTSLQRAVAAHLEQGGYIGSGYGIKK